MLGLLAGTLALVLGLALVLRIEPTRPVFPATGPDQITLYVVDNGFHTDLALPRQSLAEGEGPLVGTLAGAGGGDWIYLGWGDARFFVEEGPVMKRWQDGLRALFARNNSSVLMVRAGRDPEDLYAADERVMLKLSRPGYAQLVRSIEAGLVRDAEGQAVLATQRARDGTRFYAHKDAFWIGRLCNHWTLDGLSAAGLTIWPYRLITSGEVLRQARVGARHAERAGVDLGLQAH